MPEPLSFCSQQSRQSGIDSIGSAPEHRTYVLIECSPPWAPHDLASLGVPENLRALGHEVYKEYDRFQTQFLLIYNDKLKQDNHTRLIILYKETGLIKEYAKQEFLLADVQEVAPLVKRYLRGEPLLNTPVEHQQPTRDILICTHGSRDRCCSRFGNPLYHQALKIVEERWLNHIRIWQASHIGGHRFAPTAIDFPEARYYGYLDQASLTSVLTRIGSLQALNTVYRGWGILPWAAQMVEKELFLTHGWIWLNCKATAKVIGHNEDETFNQVEVLYETTVGSLYRCRADVIADIEQTVYLRGSCTDEDENEVTPYNVKNLVCD